MSDDNKIDGYDLEIVTEKRQTEVPSSFGAGGSEIPAQAPPDPPPVRVAGVGFGEQIKVHLGRLMGDDPMDRLLADEERWFSIAAPPVDDDTFRHFLLLRRSVIFAGAASLAVGALFLLISLLVNIGEVPGAAIAGMAVVIASVLGLAWLGYRTAADWALWRRQKKNFGFAVLGVGGASFLACLLATGGIFGIQAYAFVLLPLLVGVGAAATRASLDVKQLFPASPLGGWLVTFAAPMQALLVIASFTVVYVATDRVLVLLVLLALIAAPAGVLRASASLRRPTSSEEAAGLLEVPQMLMLAAHGVAALFIIVLVLSLGGIKGALPGLALLALVTGFYMVVRASLLDVVVAFLSEAAAVQGSDALKEVRDNASDSWAAFDRELTRDHERERGIYG